MYSRRAWKVVAAMVVVGGGGGAGGVGGGGEGFWSVTSLFVPDRNAVGSCSPCTVTKALPAFPYRVFPVLATDTRGVSFHKALISLIHAENSLKRLPVLSAPIAPPALPYNLGIFDMWQSHCAMWLSDFAAMAE